ncbi:MAG: ACP S-malonyltransferase [Saccharofermentanales bacterium]
MAGVGFVFAGQGSQYPGMGADLYSDFTCVREIFDMAEFKRPGIKEICFHAGSEMLNRTVNTQPCLFLVEVAVAAVLDENGIKADSAAGFSAGETAALCYCGVMDIEQAFDYTIIRAAAMDETACDVKGKMAAVLKTDADTIGDFCESIGDVWAVNFNCPGQTVISGRPESVDRVVSRIKACGGRAIELSVSGAFHSPLMKNAADKASGYLKCIELNEPVTPIYSNTNGERINKEDLPGIITEQICSPVFWEKTVRAMYRDGIRTFVEIGPGEVLSGLIRRMFPDTVTCSISDTAGLERFIETIGAKEKPYA